MQGSHLSDIGCNPCDYFCRIGNSVSRWCSDGSHSQQCNCGCNCIMPLFGFLTQTDAFTIPAGGTIPFTGNAVLSEGVTFENGVVMISKPGTYCLGYTIHIPVNASVDTTFVAQANGVSIPGTQQSTSHSAGMASTTVSAQGVFQVSTPTMIALTSTNALTLTPAVAGDTLATMTIEML